MSDTKTIAEEIMRRLETQTYPQTLNRTGLLAAIVAEFPKYRPASRRWRKPPHWQQNVDSGREQASARL